MSDGDFPHLGINKGLKAYLILEDSIIIFASSFNESLKRLVFESFESVTHRCAHAIATHSQSNRVICAIVEWGGASLNDWVISLFTVELHN